MDQNFGWKVSGEAQYDSAGQPHCTHPEDGQEDEDLGVHCPPKPMEPWQKEPGLDPGSSAHRTS